MTQAPNLQPRAPEGESKAELTQEQLAEEWKRFSYLSLVWQGLRKNRVAVFGLWAIFGLVLLAIFAPLIANGQPLVFRRGTELSFPLLRGLFNRLLFESAVDIFFNLALVLAPMYLLAYAVSRKLLKARFYRLRLRVIGGLFALHCAATLLFSPEQLFGLNNPLYHRERVVNYVALAHELTQKGEPHQAWFVLLPYGYRDTDPLKNVSPPSRTHWLGTDSEGRDVFARMLYGTRISLTIGVVAVSIYVAIGVALGSLAGYFGGWVDMWLSRLFEVMICFPSFFLILTIAALIEQRSIFHVMVIIGLTSWTGVARLIRAEFLKHRGLEYAEAALALGIPRFRVIFGHIMPNAIAPVLVSATFGVASAILVESSLAFLGVGDLSVPSWGETLNAGRSEQKLWLIFAPGFAIFFVVSVFNLVGEGLRDALDPKLRS
jgi:peptide/nickel transport system permease protein